MQKITTLSEREQYILRLAAHSNLDLDWKVLYICTRDKQSKATPESLKAAAYAWKNKPYIKNYFEQEKRLYQDEQQKKYNAIEAGGHSQDSGPDLANIESVNFQDRAQYINYLETRIKAATDEKTRLDYIKLLSDAQQYKKPENSETGPEYQRFYMPLSCQNCQLYQAQKAEINENGPQ